MSARKALTHLLFAFSLISIITINTNAQGVIIPRPCMRCPGPPPSPVPPPSPLPNALPVKSIKINSKIDGQVATTHVEQIFRNDTNLTLEGTYFFPIPETASIVEFAIWEGANRLVGEVRSREEARRIYDEIVRSKRDPGLLEYAGKDLFQASIFPIPPHSDKKLELKYTQVLHAEAGTVSYRYPLGTGKNVAKIGTVAGKLEIDSKEPLRNIYSPSHKIDVNNDGGRRARISFENVGETLQDFQLFYTLSKDDFGLTLLTYREPSKNGYFILMIAPKEDWSEQDYVAKDVVFVIDTSGSMSSEGKMDKAKAALQFGVNSLRANDRFNIISFAGEERLMTRGLISADKVGKSRGQEFVDNLHPTGGTNINDALIASLKQFESNDRPKILVFMTDGLPTVGETNVTRIIDNASKTKRSGVRLFTFGVGYDVNTTLLDKLAADNGGVADYVEPKEDIEVKVSSFFGKVSHPVLTDIALNMNAVETDLVYPRSLPDVFKGGQLTLIGRYRNSRDLKNVKLSLTGKVGNQMKTFSYDNLRFPLETNNNEFIPRLWANRRVGWLMEQIRINGEQKELRDEIVDLGTRYGIVTPYTSYLAIEEREHQTLTNGRPMRESRVAPRAKMGGGRGITPAAAPPIDLSSTGADAVQQSKADRALQETVVVSEGPASKNMRNIDGKTFYLENGVWIDSEFNANVGNIKEEKLVFASEAYFALIKREPQLGKYFALGEQVVVVYKGRVYRVSSSK
jgi:Ca-activated chloride channel homolog